MSGAPTEEEMDAVIDVVHAALTRNYPEFTRESVEEVLDLGNAGDVIKAIMGTSGLEMVKVSGKEEGNSQTGMNYTPISLLAQDGHGSIQTTK